MNSLVNIFWFHFNWISEIPEIQLYKGTKFQFPAAEAKPFPQAKFNHKCSKHNALPVDVYKKKHTHLSNETVKEYLKLYFHRANLEKSLVQNYVVLNEYLPG